LLHQDASGADGRHHPQLRNADKVSMLTNLFVSRQLSFGMVLLHMLLKSIHPLTMGSTVSASPGLRGSRHGRVTGRDTYFAPLVLRWLQLRLPYWFSERSPLAYMAAPALGTRQRSTSETVAPYSSSVLVVSLLRLNRVRGPSAAWFTASLLATAAGTRTERSNAFSSSNGSTQHSINAAA
jgi:hypothetical protein